MESPDPGVAVDLEWRSGPRRWALCSSPRFRRKAPLGRGSSYTSRDFGAWAWTSDGPTESKRNASIPGGDLKRRIWLIVIGRGHNPRMVQPLTRADAETASSHCDGTRRAEQMRRCSRSCSTSCVAAAPALVLLAARAYGNTVRVRAFLHSPRNCRSATRARVTESSRIAGIAPAILR